MGLKDYKISNTKTIHHYIKRLSNLVYKILESINPKNPGSDNQLFGSSFVEIYSDYGKQDIRRPRGEPWRKISFGSKDN